MKNRTYHPRNLRIHGFTAKQHPLYQTWADMLSRCTNPASVTYINYGGRGITVCERWHHFRYFAEDMGLKPDNTYTLERIDNNSGYSPDNCRWATRTEQCVNRRRFRNNRSGGTGVIQKGNTWLAKFDFKRKRHIIGWFETKAEAILARKEFLEFFQTDPQAALATLQVKQARNNSTTGVRGVSPTSKGDGFIVRVTINKIRHYVGFFKTLEEASHARQAFIDARA